ncbi:MAG TPA: cation:proton antiporter, partial [Candidatus Saccharimonadales bacterium]|nr:cation:proton antiporter [Candidatus Saccharimonadales bacterium]
MLELSTYTILTLLCGLIIVSYIFSLISEKTRIPTVLLLLFLGIGIREGLKASGNYVELPGQAIELLGVLGLILILLEAGLDINLSREKAPLIKSAVASSLFVMILSVAGISAVIHLGLGQPWLTSLIYAVPLAIISSSIVGSSVRNLGEEKREFLTYESALSDIFGILLFNYLVASGVFSLTAVLGLASGIVIAIGASVLASLLLLWLMTRVTINIKVFLMFAVLFLLYALGHQLGLPALLLVLVFGLLINNWYKVRGRVADKLLPNQSVGETAYALKALTAESAFLIRTFFFLLFGYTIDVRVLGDPSVIVVGTMVVMVIYLVRYLYLRLFLNAHI